MARTPATSITGEKIHLALVGNLDESTPLGGEGGEAEEVGTELGAAGNLYEIGREREKISGTAHTGTVEGSTKRGGGSGSQERRVRARLSASEQEQQQQNPPPLPPPPSPPPPPPPPPPPALLQPETERRRQPRVARSSGGKDRHSKVNTAKGPRDRRVRLSVPTAVQFYDVQDRLGFDQPSKAVEWLIQHAKAAIDDLAQLPQHPGATPQTHDDPHLQSQPLPHPHPHPQPPSSVFPDLLDIPDHPSYGSSYDRHGQAPIPFVQGMELHPHGPPPPSSLLYGHQAQQQQQLVDPRFDPGMALSHHETMYRTGSDVAGGSSGRAESRTKARERARERAKEKHHQIHQHEEPFSATGSIHHHPYATFPSQVSSALQHPFQVHLPPPHSPYRLYSPYPPPLPTFSNFPEPFSSSSSFAYPPAPDQPSPTSLISHYLNPPSSAFPSFGPPSTSASSASLRSFPSSLLSETQYSTSMGYPYGSQLPRPVSSTSLLGPSPGSRNYPLPPSSHLLPRPGHDRHSTTPTPHSLDPNFYNPQIPTRLQEFDELEEELKRRR